MSHGCAVRRAFPLGILRCFSRFFGLTALGVGLAAFASACNTSDTRTGQVQASNDTIYRYSAYRYQYPPAPPVIDARSLREFVGQNRDKVVVLAFWASWSPTSRSELAPLAMFQEDMYAQGVRVIACTFDPPSEWATRVVPFLQSARANYPCFVIPNEARGEVRDWLAREWNCDLPARFVFDRDGRVSYRALIGSSIDSVMDEARAMLVDGGTHHTLAPRESVGEFAPRSSAATYPAAPHDAAPHTTAPSKPSGDTPSVRAVGDRRESGAISLMARLVNVATGEAEILPVAFSAAGNADVMAAELSAYLAVRLSQAETQRIAILPFAPVAQRTRPTKLGRELAARVEAGLRRRGFADLLGPSVAESVLADAGVSAVAIDYDPTLASRRVAADFLVIGWLKGDFIESREALAIDAASDNPGVD